MRLDALQCVRTLSAEKLESGSAVEASLFNVMKDHLCSTSKLSCEELLSCWLGLFVLGCRSGAPVLAHADLFETMVAATSESVARLGAAMPLGGMDGELRVYFVAHLCAWALVSFESVTKSDPEQPT